MLPTRDLETLTDKVVAELERRPPILPNIQNLFREYHGHWKAEVGKLLIPSHERPRENVQVEIVKVDDKTNPNREVHMHRNSNAVVIILGDRQYVPFPIGASMYFERLGGWRPIMVGEKFLFTAEMRHGFSVAPGGVLYFLSVQNPPIDEGGVDDYKIVDL
jgi:hypothetical protein